MKQTIRNVSKLLTAAIGFQSLLLAINPQAAFAATPNNISTIANHVVISQVYTDGVMGQEFIELYNPTKQDISLAGFDLAKFNDPTDLTDLTDFDITQIQTTIKAGGYYLIASDTATPAVTADATYSSATHSLELFDAVALINENTGNTIIDRVGWALADKEFCEGYDSAAPAMSTCASDAAVISPVFVRQPDNSEGNGIDTDNNKNDFFVIDSTTSTVHNTSTTPRFAAAPVINSVTPSENSYSGSTVTVTAGITEEHFDSATLTIDGTSVAFNNYVSGTISFMPSTKLTDGTHTAVLSVTDKAGFSTTKTWTFNVDATKPTLRIEYQKTEVTTSGAFANIRLIYSDSLSGVNEMRTSTDGVFDTETWQPVTETARVQLPSKEGTQAIYVQVRDRAGNVSNIDSASVQIVAPAITAPDFALTSTTGNTVTITWAPVNGAAVYLVRYNDGTTLYGPITTTNTFIKIDNLDVNKKYHFEVAAVNIYGATSNYTAAYTPEQSPAKDKFMPAAATTPATVTNAVAETTTTSEVETSGQVTQRTAPSNYVSNPTPEATISPAPTPSASPEGEIKSDSDDRNPDWTKIIVALSILIIAAGVATGGWYLYQWWTSQPKDNGKGKGGRW